MNRRDWLKLSMIPICGVAEAMNNETTVQLVEQASATDFPTTMDRLLAAIEEAGMTVFARIDHAAAARSVGLSMPPTEVLLYGNPKGGTPIMLAAPRAALELPLHVLLREDSEGRTLLSFHPVAPALRRAGVPDDLTMRLEPAQRVVLKALRP
jgi:uncharacterized protein (DUF302 family)